MNSCVCSLHDYFNFDGEAPVLYSSPILPILPQYFPNTSTILPRPPQYCLQCVTENESGSNVFDDELWRSTAYSSSCWRIFSMTKHSLSNHSHPAFRPVRVRPMPCKLVASMLDKTPHVRPPKAKWTQINSHIQTEHRKSEIARILEHRNPKMPKSKLKSL